uniref:Uncharacterized protein n=1 Tax=Lepeophtheirus salmonis TaxID=72036 RepID=A0A0K2UNI3_LEPSM
MSGLGSGSETSRMVQMYCLVFIFTPADTNTKEDLPVSVRATQSITDCGFCTLLTPWSPRSTFLARIRSFWGLKSCCKMKIFSSQYWEPCQSSVSKE